MSDPNNREETAWDRVARELTSPWDWVAAGVGAVGGAGATIAFLGGDLGTSIGAGALSAVTIRKAAAASLVGRNLRQRKTSIEHEINKLEDERLRRRLGKELESIFRLWSTKGVTNDQLAKTLDRITDEILEYWGRDDEPSRRNRTILLPDDEPENG